MQKFANNIDKILFKSYIFGQGLRLKSPQVSSKLEELCTLEM